MLVPAVLVKDKLAEAYRKAQLADLDRMRFYRSGPGSPWGFEESLHNGDWDPLARASMLGDEVLGYCAVGLDRQCQNATSFQAWSVRTGSTTYLRDLDRFADYVLGQVRWMRFTLATSSPSRPIAEAWVRKHDGREVGTMHDWGTDYDGNRWDAVMYEVRGRLP